MTTTEKLSSFMAAVDVKGLSPAILNDAALAVLDLLGVAAAGSSTGAAKSARNSGGFFGQGIAPVWFSGATASEAASVLANSVAASALDLDDGERRASGHPGAGIIPVAIAVAAREGRTWPECLAAISIGYEIGVRVAASRDPRKTPTFATGRWMSFGAAAATAWLMGLDKVRFAHALAIAGTLAPNMAVNAYSKQTGNSVKEGIPWSAITGMVAASLAAEGATGPLDIFDHPTHFKAAAILGSLGSDWAIQRNYFKFYSCCRWAHAAIDAVLQMKAADPWIADAERIDIYTFERALRLNNSAGPQTIEAAQYSVPFCVALAVTHGADALLVLREEVLGDERTRNLASRVRLHVDPDLDSMFPSATPARVQVTAGALVMNQTVHHCRGDWQNRPTRHELLNKFLRLYDMAIKGGLAESIANSVLDVRHENSAAAVSELLR